eukprot:scaffold5961_cov66-Phaeocystis_antarctica.AAC.1
MNISRARSAIFSAVSTAAQAVCCSSNTRLVASVSGAEAKTPTTSGSSRSEGFSSSVFISARLAGIHQSSCFTGRSPPQICQYRAVQPKWSGMACACDLNGQG